MTPRILAEVELDHDSRCPECQGWLGQGELLLYLEGMENAWCEGCLRDAIRERKL